MTSPSPAPKPNVASLLPGAEISDVDFITRLSARGPQDPHVMVDILMRVDGGAPISLVRISSYWLEELHDVLDMISRQIRRNGSQTEYQSLGRCVGVRVENYDGKLMARLLTEDDGEWDGHEAAFDPALLPGLHAHVGDVLDALRLRAARDRQGYGFEFKVS